MGLQSGINVTPLVDVVLVLLIIFMVVTPMLPASSEVTPPVTADPPLAPEEVRRIVVAIRPDGSLWLDDTEVAPREFADAIRQAATARPGSEVVIKGDGRLAYGQVKSVMLAVQAAGFGNVGLIAVKLDTF